MSIKPAEPPQAELDEEGAQPIPEPVVPAPAEDSSNQRQYVILKEDGSGLWDPITTVTASSKQTALRSLGEDKLVDKARYRAVPERSWDPVITASVETTTTIQFAEK